MYSLDAVAADRLLWQDQRESGAQHKTIRDVVNEVLCCETEEEMLSLHQKMEDEVAAAPSVEYRVYWQSCLAYLDSFEDISSRDGSFDGIDLLRAERDLWAQEEASAWEKSIHHVMDSVQSLMLLGSPGPDGDQPMTQDEIVELREQFAGMMSVAFAIGSKVYWLSCLAYLDSFKKETGDA